jgi:hypothetical protein
MTPVGSIAIKSGTGNPHGARTFRILLLFIE